MTLLVPSSTSLSTVEQLFEKIIPSLRSAIVDSITFQCTTSVQVVFEFGSCRLTVLTRNESRKLIDLRSDGATPRTVEPPSATVDRNLRRAIGTCKSLIEKIEQDLVKTSKVNLIISFRAGQVAETDRRIISKYDTAADIVNAGE